MSGIANHVAVVLGGTSGLGKAISIGLARAGANVVASSRRQEAVDATALEIEAAGSRSVRVISDVADRDSLNNLHDQVIGVFGCVHILVNAAGVTRRIPTVDCPEELWQSIMNVNLNGTLRACQIFGKTMLARSYGRILNIASLSTYVAFHEVAAYGASKAAVGALTKSLAVEWGSQGVCVNAIAPGVFPTDLNRRLLDSPRGHELLQRTPMRRFGNLQDVVGGAIYLTSPESSFTNGEVLTIDGGFMASGVNR